MSGLVIKDLFKKDINRNIQGVIQAGQQQDEIVLDELKEYVMTNEGTEKLEMFFKHYVNTLDKPTDKMGVWISGFFGSGKSHFLKILSYLLGHRVVDGHTAYSFFPEKTDNKFLLDLMKKVDESKSDAILFNIDSKTTTNANDEEKILDVFLKVFNQYLGYSTTPWIADIERKLDEEGKYQEFKDAFKAVNGASWEETRSKVTLKRKAFAEALMKIGYDEETSRKFLDDTRQTFSIDSDSFAKIVSHYCKSKGKGYRLIFLIDEVGQYIGGNTQLMLNLQTVVEDLGNHTKGQAWVIVTSQEKIDAVKGDDFSKIQGRFATRLNLSSSNADEVIKKRLLEKKDAEYKFLKGKYETQEQSIRNMLTFDKSTTLISGFSDSDEFSQSYPFVPYQFGLLQEVFEKVRSKGEAGKHLAHGERSLLNAFQAIAVKMQNEETDNIAVFADFYDTIENFLDSSVVKTIRRAAERADVSEFEIRVLKTLYMIKDSDYIKANVENVTTLFINNLHAVKNNIEQNVIHSLNHLERLRLIEQLADKTYRYLSDEEQEMNNEIRRIVIDDERIKAKISKALFDEIYTKTSFRAETGHDFSFNRKFNDYTKGNAIYNITLQVYSGDVQETKAKMDSYTGTLVMLLPSNAEDYEEMFTYAEQISAYNRKAGASMSPSQRRILDQKLDQITEFDEKGREALEKACKNAKFYVQGNELTFAGEITNQIDKAFDSLIKNTFTKLTYMEQSVPVKQARQTIYELARNGLNGQLNVYGKPVNYLAMEEIEKFLNIDSTFTKKTLREVISNFMNIPYGWGENDVIGIIAVLLHESKIKLKYLGETFNYNHGQFLDRLTKIAEQEKVVIELEVEIPRDIKSKIARAMKNLFGDFEVGETYDAISEKIRLYISEKMQKPLDTIKIRQTRQSALYPYPGSMDILKLQNEMEELLYLRDSEQLVKEIIDREYDLEDWFGKEEKLSSFYNKTPIVYFDDGVEFLNDNKDELSILSSKNAAIEGLRKQLEDILKDENPYNRIPDINIIIDKLNNELSDEREKEKQVQRKYIHDIEKEIKDIEDFYNQTGKIKEFIKSNKRTIEETINNFENLKSYTSILATSSILKQQLETLKKAIEKFVEELNKEVAVNDDDDDYIPKPKKEVSITNIMRNLIQEDIEIDTLQKLDTYFNELQEKLKKELRDMLKNQNLVIKK